MQNTIISKLRSHLWQVFWGIILCWIIITIYISYRYIISLWSEVQNKGGTYVEGIFWPTSYLPFLASDEQSKFYQSLLFDSCSEVRMQEFGPEYVQTLCNIQTNDNINFTITINPWSVWSNGTPVDIDDIYFTYKNIIVDNMRAIPTLSTYNDIKIEKISDTSIQVTFAKRSIDNKLFFTYNILPRQVLADKTFDYYRTEFAQKPIYTKCAQLKPQSNDLNSLVFDVSKCNETYLGFYQIKNVDTFESFSADHQINNKSIIDAYQGGEELEWYIGQPIITHAYTTIFFNTNSSKMGVRLRRSLAWLINYNFYTGNSEKFIRKDQWIFNNFMSTWSNIEEFLTRITPDGKASIAELEESWVKNLTNKSISFNEKERKNAYYINTNPFSVEVNISLSTSTYPTLGIKYGEVDKGNISSYDKTKRTAKHTIPLKDIKPGLNTYTLYTKDKDKAINIGSITIYVLDNKAPEQLLQTPETTITIIYQNTIPTQKVVQHLKSIFESINIADFFIFRPLSTRDEMEVEIAANEYDLAIIPIERWLKKDISPILKTSDPITNPSQYTNPQFSTLFEQYIQFDQDNKSIRDEIIAIYTRDIPFMILGKQVSSIYVRPDIYEQIFLMNTGMVFENNWRQMIYDNLSRAKTMHIDTENIWWIKAFWKFVSNTLFPWRNIEEQETSQEINKETVW